MALNAEHRINDVVRGIALIAESGRNSLDLAALMRTILEHRREAAEQRLDRDACGGWLDAAPGHAGRAEPPLNDAEVASIEVVAKFYGAITRLSKEWQRVIEKRAPKVRRLLEQYQQTNNPGPIDREAVILELRLLFEEIGWLIRDQAVQIERDLRLLQEELLPYLQAPR